MKISLRVFELLPGHEIMTDGQTYRQTDGQTDRRTDRQGDYYRALRTSSCGALINKYLRMLSAAVVIGALTVKKRSSE